MILMSTPVMLLTHSWDWWDYMHYIYTYPCIFISFISRRYKPVFFGVDHTNFCCPKMLLWERWTLLSFGISAQVAEVVAEVPVSEGGSQGQLREFSKRVLSHKCWEHNQEIKTTWYLKETKVVSHINMKVSINGGTPIAGWFMMENPSINGWLGVAPF